MREPTARRLIDFFIVGAQKAATTALAYKLGLHSRICCSAPKELHLFDDDKRDWELDPTPDMSRHFALHQADTLWGEATPITMYWPGAMTRLARYNPEARIIVSLRHPAYRALSHWKMESVRGNEVLSFHEAVSAEGRARVSPVHRIYSYVERGFYAGQIARILQCFPREHVLFIRMEDLFLQEEQLLQTVFRFLGLEEQRIAAGPKRVVSVDSSAVVVDARDEIARLTCLYRQDIEETARLTGLDLSSWADDGDHETYLAAQGGDREKGC